MVGLDESTFRRITAVSGNVLTVAAVVVNTGDVLVNLGLDGGATEPDYLGSTAVIYSTPNTTTVITDSQVTTDAGGEYGYWHDGTSGLWELILNSQGAPTEIVLQAYQPGYANNIRYVSLYATGGLGTSGVPWTGWETVFDSSPREVVFGPGYYTWATRKTVSAISSTDRDTRFSLSGSSAGGTNINVTVTAALTISGTGGQGGQGCSIRDLNFYLSADLSPLTGTNPYQSGIIVLNRANDFNLENITLVGGAQFPGTSNAFLSYAGYLLAIIDSYHGLLINVKTQGRFVYMFEQDDSATGANEEDTTTVIGCLTQGPLQGIFRYHSLGYHNFTFINNKYQTNISYWYEVNQFDETWVTSNTAAGSTSLPVNESRGFSIGDPILIGHADDVDSDLGSGNNPGGRVELNQVAGKADSTHITLKYPTRFAQPGAATDDGTAGFAASLVRHGGVGFSCSKPGSLLAFYSSMFEQASAGILVSGTQFLSMYNILSSSWNLVELVPFASGTYGSTLKSDTSNLWDVDMRMIQTTLVPTFTSSTIVSVDQANNELTFTPSASSSLNHIQDRSPVKYHTTGTEITGLINDTVYYAIKISAGDGTAYTAPNQSAVAASDAIFKLATTRVNAANRIAIDFTGAGSGTQTLETTTSTGVAPLETSLIRVRRLADSSNTRSIKTTGTRKNSTATCLHYNMLIDDPSEARNALNVYEVSGSTIDERIYPSTYSALAVLTVKLGTGASGATNDKFIVKGNGDTTVNALSVAGNASTTGYVIRSVTAGITASTTQTQGQGALTTDINEISVCANANDTVTMPAAAAGLHIKIINNGAQTLQIFPASGDQFSGSSVNASVTLATATNTRYTAINSTLWEAI
jgi:hypothetical protein